MKLQAHQRESPQLIEELPLTPYGLADMSGCGLMKTLVRAFHSQALCLISILLLGYSNVFIDNFSEFSVLLSNDSVLAILIAMY